MRYQAMTGFACVDIQVEASTPEEAEQKVREQVKLLQEHLAKLPDTISVEVEAEDMENVEEIKE